jgi:hypothetical protein
MMHGTVSVAAMLVNTFSYELYALNLAASDFTSPFGADPASQPTHPDFSAGSAPIRFGFHVANSSAPGAGAYSTIGDYSDFTVSFVPAPGVATLLALAGLRGRRRG